MTSPSVDDVEAQINELEQEVAEFEESEKAVADEEIGDSGSEPVKEDEEPGAEEMKTEVTDTTEDVVAVSQGAKEIVPGDEIIDDSVEEEEEISKEEPPLEVEKEEGAEETKTEVAEKPTAEAESQEPYITWEEQKRGLRLVLHLPAGTTKPRGGWGKVVAVKVKTNRIFVSFEGKTVLDVEPFQPLPTQDAIWSYVAESETPAISIDIDKSGKEVSPFWYLLHEKDDKVLSEEQLNGLHNLVKANARSPQGWKQLCALYERSPERAKFEMGKALTGKEYSAPESSLDVEKGLAMIKECSADNADASIFLAKFYIGERRTAEAFSILQELRAQQHSVGLLILADFVNEAENQEALAANEQFKQIMEKGGKQFILEEAIEAGVPQAAITLGSQSRDDPAKAAYYYKKALSMPDMSANTRRAIEAALARAEDQLPKPEPVVQPTPPPIATPITPTPIASPPTQPKTSSTRTTSVVSTKPSTTTPAGRKTSRTRKTTKGKATPLTSKVGEESKSGSMWPTVGKVFLGLAAGAFLFHFWQERGRE